MGLPPCYERRRQRLGASLLGGPGEARRAWDRITADPRDRDDRQHPLKGSLGSRIVNGLRLEQWQFEVTAGGHIWFCIGDEARTVWMTDASVGHPKATE